MYFRNIATYEWKVYNDKMETSNTVNCGYVANLAVSVVSSFKFNGIDAINMLTLLGNLW